MSVFSKEPKFYSGGGGLVSTANDYHNFCLMLLNKGEFEGKRILSRKTVELMTINHLPDNQDMISMGSEGSFSEVRYKGVGFGLGFGIWNRGIRGWGGIANTYFFIDIQPDIVSMIWTQ